MTFKKSIGWFSLQELDFLFPKPIWSPNRELQVLSLRARYMNKKSTSSIHENGKHPSKISSWYCSQSPNIEANYTIHKPRKFKSGQFDGRNIKQPTFDHVNRLIAQCISSCTTSLRFETQCLNSHFQHWGSTSKWLVKSLRWLIQSHKNNQT